MRMLTIDGPAGTGKSVTAKAMAQRLALIYLDSGALYRAIALAIDSAGIDVEDPASLEGFLRAMDLTLAPERDRMRVLLDGRDVSGELRDEALGGRASRLATLDPIRRREDELLRAAGGQRACVAEGRDMGSVVFPNAQLKIYLTASTTARVERRIAQLREAGGAPDEEQVRAEMADRDYRDSSRRLSPLREPAGAIRIDTTHLTLDEQISIIEQLYRGHGRLRGSWGYRVARVMVIGLAQGLLGVRVRGREQVPLGPYLAASNHQSYTDPPVVCALQPGHMVILAKEELFKIPLLAPIIRAFEAIPVRRGTADRRALRAALGALKRGLPLLLFPEGTRIRGPGLGRPHAGVAWLARKAHVPVVPIRIHGGTVWQSMLRIKPIYVVFGKPMLYEGEDQGAQGDRAFAESVMVVIEKLGEIK